MSGEKKCFQFLKKIFCSTFFLSFLTLPIFSEIPEKLSENAVISILSVNYDDFSHSLFSKNCLRIYDKETSFDKVIDFAHFDDFDDEFFLLKFFFNSKNASVRVEPFMEYFLELSEQTTVSLIESVLNLTPSEVDYIFSFLSTMHSALPNYEYEFDILTNNSETHISQILHDASRMAGNPEQNGETYSFSEISRHNLKYEKLDDAYTLLSQKEKLQFNHQDFTPKVKISPALIFLIVFSSLIFLLTCYQVLVYFLKKGYRSSVFKTAQILDFLILFFAGIFGTIILWQDLFSNQTLFQNNFHFLFLFPLHLVAAFTVFKPIKNSKLKITYWSLVNFLALLFILVSSIIQNELPLVNLLLATPIFLRTAYFDFLAITDYFL